MTVVHPKVPCPAHPRKVQRTGLRRFLGRFPGGAAIRGQEGSDSAKVLHNEKLAPAEEAVDIAADLHINYALAFLRDSGHWGEQNIIK